MFIIKLLILLLLIQIHWWIIQISLILILSKPLIIKLMLWLLKWLLLRLLKWLLKLVILLNRLLLIWIILLIFVFFLGFHEFWVFFLQLLISLFYNFNIGINIVFLSMFPGSRYSTRLFWLYIFLILWSYLLIVWFKVWLLLLIMNRTYNIPIIRRIIMLHLSFIWCRSLSIWIIYYYANY